MTQRNSPPTQPVTSYVIRPAFSLGRALLLNAFRLGLVVGLFLICSGAVQMFVGSMH